MNKWLVIVLIFFSGYATISSAGCHEATETSTVTSTSNTNAAMLGFPRDTILAAISQMPTLGRVTAFEQEYLHVVARSAVANGRDPSQIFVPVLPYASFNPSSYAAASRQHPAPISVLTDSKGDRGLLVALSPARLLTLAAREKLSCGAPLVLGTDELNELAGQWARDVLPQPNKRTIKRFTRGLPKHLKFLPTLLSNSGGGGPFPFTEVVTSATERCLNDSLPFLEALLTRAFSTPNPNKTISGLIAAPTPDLVSLQPACLKH